MDRSFTEAESGIADRGERKPSHGTLEALSVCLIAHNEAHQIDRAVASVLGWAGEVIVLDCESTDETARVAEQAGAVVYRGPNRLPEANKNACMSYASREWIFLLDADELMTESLKREIERTIERNPSESAFRIPRLNYYFGAPLRHGGIWPDRQTRLFRRGKGRYPGVDIHETLIVEGTTGSLTGYFEHHPYPTYDAWIDKFNIYTGYEVMRNTERKVPITSRVILRRMVLRPLRRWLKRLFIKQGIRDGVPGVPAATFDLMTQVVGFGRYWIETRRDVETKGGDRHEV